VKPVQQRYHRGREIDGVPGDCFRACIASILELPLSAVPHFSLEVEFGGQTYNRWVMVDEFLASHNLLRCVVFHKLLNIEALFHTMSNWAPSRSDFYYILDGESSTPGLLHSVVASRSRIRHNPSPTATIIGPGDFGYSDKHFRVHIFMPLDAISAL